MASSLSESSLVGTSSEDSFGADSLQNSPVASSSSANPLVVSGVIGDVIDEFVPTVAMSVNFGSQSVNNDYIIKTSTCKDPPQITITGTADELYTLVMTDPDAPETTKSSGTGREWIHWIVCDIPGGSHPIKGDEVLPYIRPNPRRGIHRYVLVVFKQKGPLGRVVLTDSRAGFSTRYFAYMNDLGLPAAAVFFYSQKHHANRMQSPTQ